MKKTLIPILLALMVCGPFSARCQEVYFTTEQLPDLIQCLPAPPDTLSSAFTYDIMR